MHYKFNSKPLTSKDRLSELSSILYVAIARLYSRERASSAKKSLDFSAKQSVTSVANRYGD